VAGTTAFAYFAIHSLGDWLYEYPGIAAPAFALLGIACALRPRTFKPPAVRRPGLRGLAPVAGVVALTVVLVVAMAGPWLSERYVTHAAASWRSDTAQAFRSLDRAAALFPWSPRPQLVAGTIALRLGDRERADEEFRAALDRDPRNTYALLELGALEANRGDRRAALALLGRALALNPRDPFVPVVIKRVRSGERVNLDAVNSRIVDNSRKRVSPR
jgi:tetratricopeptide (TPR) repeat protein